MFKRMRLARSRALFGVLFVGIAGIALVGCKTEAEKHYDKAKRLRDLGQYEESAREFEAVIQIDPSHVESYYRLGHVYWENLDELEKAAQAFRSVVDIDPLYAKAWRKLAEIQEELGDVEAAAKTIEEGLAAGAFEDNAETDANMRARLENLKRGEPSRPSSRGATAQTSPPATDETGLAPDSEQPAVEDAPTSPAG